MILATTFSSQKRAYTGVELRPHFLLSELGLKGSGIGAFVGPCKVSTEHLVDWEDRLANDHIQAESMVHFIGEFFGASLREGVFMQRLIMATMADVLNRRIASGARVWRSGDDLFVGEGSSARKLSVSIVTASPVSLLLHTGINIEPAGAPVPAIGLSELGIDPVLWAKEVLLHLSTEFEEISWACAKVRPVM